MKFDFEEIYRLYFRDVYLFVLALSKNPDIAEEITQETFFKALKGIRHFKGNCSVNSWLCQIAKNQYISHMRKQKTVSVEEIDLPAAEGNPENTFLQKEDTISIYKILHLLDEPYKEVFILRTLGDLSFKEIGEIFNCQENWARVTYHRARLKIKQHIHPPQKGGMDHDQTTM